jgi:hypothetical protein
MPSGSSNRKRAKAQRSINPKGFSSEKLEAISLIASCEAKLREWS